MSIAVAFEGNAFILAPAPNLEDPDNPDATDTAKRHESGAQEAVGKEWGLHDLFANVRKPFVSLKGVSS